MSAPILKAAALAVTGTITALLLQRGSRELAIPLALAVCALIFQGAAALLTPILETLDKARALTGLSAAFFAPLVKCVGIAFAARLAADLCKDGGQSAMASAVELMGAVGAVYAALPLFATLLDMLEELL